MEMSLRVGWGGAWCKWLWLPLGHDIFLTKIGQYWWVRSREEMASPCSLVSGARTSCLPLLRKWVKVRVKVRIRVSKQSPLLCLLLPSDP